MMPLHIQLESLHANGLLHRAPVIMNTGRWAAGSENQDTYLQGAGFDGDMESEYNSYKPMTKVMTYNSCSSVYNFFIIFYSKQKLCSMKWRYFDLYYLIVHLTLNTDQGLKLVTIGSCVSVNNL
jgi:hypothetical protein